MPPAAALAGVSANSSANNVGCKAFKTEDVFNSNKKHDSKCQCKTLTKLWQTHTGSQLSGARHVLTGTQAHSGGLLQPSSGCSSMNTARLGQYELPLNPKQHFFIISSIWSIFSLMMVPNKVMKNLLGQIVELSSWRWARHAASVAKLHELVPLI